MENKTKKDAMPIYLLGLMGIVVILFLFNQFQIGKINEVLEFGVHGKSTSRSLLGAGNLDDVDTTTLKSTAHTIAAVYPVEDIQTQEDAMAVMFPTGTPDYGEALGVTYDDPVTSLDTLAKMFRPLKAEVEANDPEAFARFAHMASSPMGISCEYCCGIGPIGANPDGSSRCGCSHNPGLLSVALYLSAYTDYTDGEILREIMNWKTLWFPRNMIELGMTVAGSDLSTLEELPGMVGGC